MNILSILPDKTGCTRAVTPDELDMVIFGEFITSKLSPPFTIEI